MKIIGITGPSGSGKTVLTEHLSELGIPTVDADALYHSMLIPPSACLDAIRDKFGDGVFFDDGSLNRIALGEIVFNDKNKLNLLNSTVLHMVLTEIRSIIKEYDCKGINVVAVDAPTLIESGFNSECHIVISVIAPKENRISRIMERDNINMDKAVQRVEAQMDDDFYIRHSDLVILNNGTRAEYAKQISDTLNKLGL